MVLKHYKSHINSVLLGNKTGMQISVTEIYYYTKKSSFKALSFSAVREAVPNNRIWTLLQHDISNNVPAGSTAINKTQKRSFTFACRHVQCLSFLQCEKTRRYISWKTTPTFVSGRNKLLNSLIVGHTYNGFLTLGSDSKRPQMIGIKPHCKWIWRSTKMKNTHPCNGC